MAVSTIYYVNYLLYNVTPQTCPLRWCAHHWGCRWGIRSFYPFLRLSQAVGRRFTLHRYSGSLFIQLLYLIHTHPKGHYRFPQVSHCEAIMRFVTLSFTRCTGLRRGGVASNC